MERVCYTYKVFYAGTMVFNHTFLIGFLLLRLCLKKMEHFIVTVKNRKLLWLLKKEGCITIEY